MATTTHKTVRTALLLAATLLALVVFSGVALAVTVTCTTNPCEGTSGPDTLYERVYVSGNPATNLDTIYGGGGDDDIIATKNQADGEDKLYGGRGVDVLNAQDRDADDMLNGGKGFDVCYIDLDTDIGFRDATTGCENVRVSEFSNE